MQHIFMSFMPQRVKQAFAHLAPQLGARLEEIRIRIERPIELMIQNESFFLTESGSATRNMHLGMIATHEDGHKILNLISRHSIYAIEEELRRGYITISGGHRVGIVGRAVVEQGKIKLLKDIRSFNFRLAKEIKGIGEALLPSLIHRGELLNTCIISPPRCGKTTLLRDLTRIMSYGCPAQGMAGQKIGVVDERSEIASCLDGVPQNDVGPRTDVLDACPKAEGMILLVRSMSPDIIVTDEIGSKEDAQAIQEALYAGVKIMTTMHGSSLLDVERRPSLLPLFQEAAFDRYVILSSREGVGTIEAIYDANRSNIYHLPGGKKHA